MALSPGGDTLWTRQYRRGGLIPGDELFRALPLEDGGYCLVGECSDRPEFPNVRQYDLWILRVSAAGDTLWTHRIGEPAKDERATAVARLSTGDFIIAGDVHDGASGDRKIFLACVSSGGEERWTRTFDAEGDFCRDSRTTSVSALPDGQFELCGGAQLSHPGPLTEQPLLIRFSAAGDTVWTRAYHPPQPFYLATSAATVDGGHLLAGGIGDLYTDLWVARTAPTMSLTPGRLPPIVETPGLAAPSPNPFNASTRIRFSLPRGGQVRLTVYDLLGREVATVAEGLATAGEHAVLFDGSGLSSGVYFVRLEAEGGAQMRKVMLVK